MGEEVFIIDDRDAAVSFQPGIGLEFYNWDIKHGSRLYGGTLTETWELSNTATVRFSGTSIQVFGTIDQEFDAYFAIDFGPQDRNRNYPGRRRNNQLLWTSPELGNGPHTLVITNNNDAFPLGLDYFQVTVKASSTSSSPPVATVTETRTTTKSFNTFSSGFKAATFLTSSTVASTSLSRVAPSQSHSSSNSSHVSPTLLPSTPSHSTSTSTSSSTTSGFHPPSAVSASGSNRLPKGAIIGISVGGAVLLGIILGLIFLWCRRRRARMALQPYPLNTQKSPSTERLVLSRVSGRTISEKAQLKALEASLEATTRQDSGGPSPRQNTRSDSSHSLGEQEFRGNTELEQAGSSPLWLERIGLFGEDTFNYNGARVLSPTTPTGVHIPRRHTVAVNGDLVSLPTGFSTVWTSDSTTAVNGSDRTDHLQQSENRRAPFVKDGHDVGMEDLPPYPASSTTTWSRRMGLAV